MVGGVPRVMLDVHARHHRLLATARTRSGVVTTAELRSLGYSWHRTKTLLRRGILVPFAGQFIVPDAEAPLVESHARAITQRLGDDGVLTGAIAAHYLGAGGDWSERFGVDVPMAYVPGHSNRSIAGAVLVRGTMDGTRLRRKGYTVADRTTALVDCLELADPDRRRDLLDYFLQRRWLDRDSTIKRLDERVRSRMGRRSSPTQAALRSLLEEGTQSAAERAVADALRRSGLFRGRRRGWLSNVEVTVPSQTNGCRESRVCQLDFAWPDCRLALEVDGRAFHTSDEAFERDRLRRNDLQAAGWTVQQVTWKSIHDTESAVIDQVRSMLESLRARDSR